MGRRTQKFYNKNEKQIMKAFGLIPTPGSGNKWKFKEDGYNEQILCQHKSTDAESYRISRIDMDKLEYHASVEHKVPVFMVQFLEDDKVYLILEPQYIEDVYKHLTLPKNALQIESQSQVTIPEDEDEPKVEKKMIKSSKNAKNKLNEIKLKEMEKQNEKFKANQKRFKK